MTSGSNGPPVSGYGQQYLDLWSAALPAKPGAEPKPKSQGVPGGTVCEFRGDNVIDLAQYRIEREQS